MRERNVDWFGELDDEPPDLPTPSLAWTMWHPIWWLSVLLAHSNGSEVPTADEVPWPGPAHSLPVIQERWSAWMGFVDRLRAEELHAGALTRST